MSGATFIPNCSPPVATELQPSFMPHQWACVGSRRDPIRAARAESLWQCGSTFVGSMLVFDLFPRETEPSWFLSLSVSRRGKYPDPRDLDRALRAFVGTQEQVIARMADRTLIVVSNRLERNAALFALKAVPS